MDLYHSHLNQIIKANNENRLAIFIGSGVSKSADTESFQLPLWGDLIKSMSHELEITNEHDYLKIAQLYFLEFGEPTYYSKIRSFFPENIPHSEIHKTIFEISPNCIITTNWDCLLESAIITTGALYNVICSDKDLVKSTHSKKMIKMHGDFNNHNIVFKEDDYLSYSHNFPLIENYIKSILSTHTVLFIGYSYNDVNLKQITKWIQNHSSYCPPMYMATLDSNLAQVNYLDNHGIKVIKLPAEIAKIAQRFNHLPERSRSLASLLDDILNSRYRSDDKITDSEVISEIYDRIKHLEALKSVLIDQVRKLFPNCELHYENNKQLLIEFHPQNIIRANKNDSRSINLTKRFVEILSNQTEKTKEAKTSKITAIFSKAAITGIVIKNLDDGSKMIHEVKKIDDPLSIYKRKLASDKASDKSGNINDINYKLSKSFYFYSIGDYFQAYQLNKEALTLCKAQKNYTQLLISISNLNTITHILSFIELARKNSNQLKKYNTEEDIQVIDIQDQFIQLPRTEIKKQQVLFDFLSLNSIHEKSAFYSNELIQINEANDSIKNGGIYYRKDIQKSVIEHENIQNFITLNNLISLNDSVKSLMSKFIEISISRQSLKEEIQLSFTEIFTCIQFFKEEKINKIFHSNFDAKNKERKKLIITSENIEFTVNDILTEIVSRHLEATSFLEFKEREFNNSLCILQYVKLNDETLEKILIEMLKIMDSDRVTFKIYHAISNFFKNQHEIFGREINTEIIFTLIERMITKIVRNNAKPSDIHIITNGHLDIFYKYVEINKEVYKNSALVEKLITEIKNLKFNDKIDLTYTLLYSIFRIGNSEIQQLIKDFSAMMTKTAFSSLNDKIDFTIWALATGFLDDISDEDIQLFESHIENLSTKTSLHHDFSRTIEILNLLIQEGKLIKLIPLYKLFQKMPGTN